MKSGVDGTSANGLSLCVDWFSFTLPDNCSPAEVIGLMGYALDDFQLMPSGRFGYRKFYKNCSHNVCVLFDGNEGMGVHVDVSGSAVSDLMVHFNATRACTSPFGGSGIEVDDFDSTVFRDFCKVVQREKGGHFTRIDLAIDDRGAKFFTVGEVRDYLSGGAFVSLFRKWKEVFEHESTVNGCKNTGATIYVGSRASGVMLRIYDKAAEQNKKLLAAGDVPLLDAWTRWEFELKKDYADNVAALFIVGDSLADIAVGLLNNYLRLINPDKSRKSRCSVCEKWQAFIDGIAKVRLFVQKELATIDSKQKWIRKQVAPSLAAIVLADGGCVDFLYNLIDDGRRRMKPYLWQLVYREQGACS